MCTVRFIKIILMCVGQPRQFEVNIFFCFKKYKVICNKLNNIFFQLSFRFLIKQIWKVVSVILYRKLQKKNLEV